MHVLYTVSWTVCYVTYAAQQTHSIVYKKDYTEFPMIHVLTNGSILLHKLGMHSDSFSYSNCNPKQTYQILYMSGNI